MEGHRVVFNGGRAVLETLMNYDIEGGATSNFLLIIK